MKTAIDLMITSLNKPKKREPIKIYELEDIPIHGFYMEIVENSSDYEGCREYRHKVHYVKLAFWLRIDSQWHDITALMDDNFVQKLEQEVINGKFD